MVFVEGKLRIGEIMPIKITGAMAYDLTGVPAPPVGIQTLQTLRA
jgi:hypothetical protein